MRVTYLLFCSALLSSCSAMDFFTKRDTKVPPRPVKSFTPEKSQMHSHYLPVLDKASLFDPEPFVLTYNGIAEISSLLGEGNASWYGADFHGRSTASGERYNMHDLTAAHPSLPFGTLVWVKNVDNGRSALVRINDRGPFLGERVIDLSREAAQKLGMTGEGLARVHLYLAERNKGDNSAVKAAERLYTIQLGAFETAEKAFAFARNINKSRVEVVQEYNKTYFGVFYGLYANRSKAFCNQQKLQQQKDVTGLVKEREV